MIKIIIFDLGQVIFKFDWKKALPQAMRVCTAPPDEIIKFITTSEADRLFVEGKITGEEFFTEAKKALGLSVTINEFRDMYNNIFDQNEAVCALIERLKESYMLAILSNTNRFHFDCIMETYPIMKAFTYYFVSHEMHCQKPSYEIFGKTLSRLNAAPQEVLFIDDMEENVIVAQQIGIRGIHYASFEQLMERLKRHNILVQSI